VPKLVIPPSTTAKQILKGIDDWGAERKGQEGKKLWDVLAALRGPDDGDIFLKARTTSVIRLLAVPRYARRHVAVASKRTEFRMPPDRTHFNWHIRDAAEALNLKDGGK
jgi:hypothetical protein